MRLWDIVKSIIEAEEKSLMDETQRVAGEVKQLVPVSRTVNIRDETLTETFELVVDGVGRLETLVLKTLDKNWLLTIITEQGIQYFRESFDSLSDVSLGNPQLDVQDRTQYEGYYFVNVKSVSFLKRLEVYIQPTPSTSVKNIFALYYVSR